MTTHTETDAERIARRYPGSRTPRWLWLVAVAAILAVGVPWLIWTATYGANPAISAKIVSFSVTSDQTIDVRVTTQRPDPARPAVCTLTAQAVTYDTVGQYVLELPPGSEELEHHDVTIRTFKRPTSVKIEGCTPR
ncbi:DUF4307 domain-containing protein [Propioniciclava coleopterorum]|uniref:DUF4307 domain-containing protein n=1 Tax=Propioniciclava coleopterorum TaxID=2714937 RepID=A0A6G7Y4K6_9ACTN|nr:DUF4307 domain-containing protein [Propioniciclava coleopterorum]QIK71568.1 DUF4307 domain-containing protein [Propioniciclava coleopterorum]